MDSIDELLAKLKSEAERDRSQKIEPPKSSDPKSGIDALLQEIEQTPSVPISLADTTRSQSSDSLLEQVRSQYDQFDQVEAEQQAEAERQAQQQQAQQEKEKQQRLEQLRAQRRAELRTKAEEWLKNLKPQSSEGKWFEEFACNYSSRLDAAIDYLEALSEVEPEL